MFLRKAKIDLSNCLMNLQKSRSEILITGDKMEKLQASRQKRQLEDIIVFARNVSTQIERLIQVVPSKEDVEQRQKEKAEEVKESKERWSMKWQLN